MLGPALYFLLVAAAQAARTTSPSQTGETQPQVTSTPDWSDFRIYPKAALDREQEGRVQARVLVGTDGVPKHCEITSTSNFKELDAGTCDLMMKMRFKPARDSKGGLVQSSYERPFEWRLTERAPFEAGTLSVSAKIRNGLLNTCEVLRVSGPYEDIWRRTACTFLTDTPYFFRATATSSANAVVEIRVDPQDPSQKGAVAQTSDNPAAAEKIGFDIDAGGNPVNCKSIDEFGFGPRGLNDLSPCGRFLSSLWFEVTPGMTKHGIIETRVYMLPN